MAAFIKLDDSPMFLKQIYSIEQTTDQLESHCGRLYKGCRKFMAALGEGCNGYTAFADSLEAFGGGRDDPVSVSIGGPVLSKFITTLRELATYKEFLRSQVEHVLHDRLTHFINVDLKGAKDSRQRFDKAAHTYDQARERFVSLRKNTREDVVAELEEDLQNSKSEFEKTRFNLVNALVNVEAKKKYEFLESFSAMMDAHLRYFKLGYDLFSQMEPFIHQVFAYAQQSKEQTNIEQDKLAKRIQEFRTQAELDSLQASSCLEPSSIADGIHGISISSYRNVESIMPSNVKGEVQTIKQGYLLKRSSLKGYWKRRFFALDSQSALYYYKVKGLKPMGSQSYHFTRSAEQNSSMFGRFRSKHNRASSLNEEIFSCYTIDLRTSTIKMDADDIDLRLCFRIISPSKTLTLQAENEADRMDWVNKITRAIASLFSSHFLQQPCTGRAYPQNNNSNSGSSDHHNHSEDDKSTSSVSKALREIPGNDLCAECSAPDPDWASLNLGILLCIECSGVHRNLGVHISKGLLLLPENERANKSDSTTTSVTKPCPQDSIHHKEKYIHAKYVDKLLVIKELPPPGITSYARSIWEAVKTSNFREVYRLIIVSSENIINTTFDDVVDVDSYPHPDAQVVGVEREENDPTSCDRINSSDEREICLQGCSLLHLSCHYGNAVMLELLLQFGANIIMRDFHGRTPLHHCISRRNDTFAKLLLRRGARTSIKDGGGLSALERAMEMGAITDDELFLLLAECE